MKQDIYYNGTIYQNVDSDEQQSFAGRCSAYLPYTGTNLKDHQVVVENVDYFISESPITNKVVANPIHLQSDNTLITQSEIIGGNTVTSTSPLSDNTSFAECISCDKQIHGAATFCSECEGKLKEDKTEGIENLKNVQQSMPGEFNEIVNKNFHQLLDNTGLKEEKYCNCPMCEYCRSEKAFKELTNEGKEESQEELWKEVIRMPDRGKTLESLIEKLSQHFILTRKP